ATVAILGVPLGEATWSLAGWTPDVAIAAPAVRLQGTTLRVDLGGLPPETAFAASPSVTATTDGTATTLDLPADAVTEGE
ncbi:hypothetical protein NL529_33495, partial [Klebsiella pneumoniae]|nr:hypothetical protein [Klebsiella pneumoniae]